MSAANSERSDFHIKVPGKWVLAGEHAVLKGATAVALPHPEFALSLDFKVRGVKVDGKSQNSALTATQTPESGEIVHFTPSDFLEVQPESAQKVVGELISQIQQFSGTSSLGHEQDVLPPRALNLLGRLDIKSTIPVGAGLGSSAALCVGITRWLSEPLRIPQDRWVAIATQLENHFHGKSSGMDVAVISAGTPVAFSMREGARPLSLTNLPRFTFHDTGLRASTKECIQKVQAFRARSADSAVAGCGDSVDQCMAQASLDALEGLKEFSNGSQQRGLALVAQAMQAGQSCFEAWDLMPAQAIALKTQLLEQGAVAVKLTGAGGGGMLVALWH